jgi:hypothetical protein
MDNGARRGRERRSNGGAALFLVSAWLAEHCWSLAWHGEADRVEHAWRLAVKDARSRMTEQSLASGPLLELAPLSRSPRPPMLLTDD